MREAAQHGLQLAGPRVGPEQPAGQAEHREPGRRRRHDPGHALGRRHRRGARSTRSSRSAGGRGSGGMRPAPQSARRCGRAGGGPPPAGRAPAPPGAGSRSEPPPSRAAARPAASDGCTIGEPGIVEQAAQHGGRAGLHHVEHPGEDRPPGGAAQDRRDVDEEPPGRVVRPAGGPATGSAGGWPYERGRRRTPITRKADEAHRRDRPVQPLRQAEAEVDPELVVRRAAVREREQRGDRPGLGEPERAGRVDRPLGVLRRAVVLLDPGAERGQRAELVVGQAGGVRSPAGRPLPCRRPGAARTTRRLSPRRRSSDVAGRGVDARSGRG